MKFFPAFTLVILLNSLWGFYVLADSSDEDIIVEDSDSDDPSQQNKKSSEDEEESPKTLGDDVADHAYDTHFAFISMFDESADGHIGIYAGKKVEFILGLANRGHDVKQNLNPEYFQAHYLEAALRYPFDYSYHLQNFSRLELTTITPQIKLNEEATFSYTLIPADAFIGRPIGLTVNLGFVDNIGNTYIEPVFNQTVQILELDEGLKADTLVMYIVIALFFGGLIYAGYTFLAGRIFGTSQSSSASSSGGHGRRGHGNDSSGSGNAGDGGLNTEQHPEVDYEWIPKSALRINAGHSDKSGPPTPQTSPRQRKGRANVIS